MTNVQKIVYTDMVETELLENSVFAEIANGKFKRNTPVVNGASVEILGTESISIGQYSGTMTHQTLDGTAQAVPINKRPYYSVKLDGVTDLATAPKDLKEFATNKAGATLAEQFDVEGVKLATKAKVTVTGTKSDIGAVFEGMAAELDIANVGMNNRAAVIDPVTARRLIGEQGSAIHGDNAGSIVYQGYIGEYQGFKIFKSNKLPKVTTKQTVIGVDMTALVLPRNFEDMREIEDADFWGVYIQGIISYGIDVIETETGKSNRIVKGEIDYA